MNGATIDPIDFSFHDAWVERVSMGPRREMAFELDLGSARISDPRLPGLGRLRFGGIEESDAVFRVFSKLGEEGVGSRIDQVVFTRSPGSKLHQVRIELDPEGPLELCCSKLSFAEMDELSSPAP